MAGKGRRWRCGHCPEAGISFAAAVAHANDAGHAVELEKPPRSPFADLTDEEFLALPRDYVINYGREEDDGEGSP